jgi:hypothetical protein
MAYRSVFVFDDGSDWTSDWTDVVDFRLLAGSGRGGFGLFTRLDHPYQGETPPNRWRGMNNTLTLVREDHEELKDLFNVVNAPPLGEPVYQIIRAQAEAASRQLPPLVNVFFQPPIRFSYAYGSYAVGPGKEQGGLPFVPDDVRDQPLLTIKVSLHINTPPGASSIDADIVYYVALRIENGHVATEIIGSAHPWRFHGDGYGAYQDEIDLGLEDAANNAVQGLHSFLELIQAYRGSELYLVPGRAVSRQPEGHALRGSVRSAMTLALLP